MRGSLAGRWGAMRAAARVAGLVASLAALPAAAQTVTADGLVEELTRTAPAARGLHGQQPAAGVPDAAAEAFLRALPARGLTIEARSQLATITESQALPRVDVEIPFDFDSATLREDVLPDLIAIGDALTAPQLSGLRFALAGHTDGVGAAAYNQELSERRALAVRDFLLQRFAIAPDRLVAVGFGLERLKTPADPRAAENRRVEVINLEVRWD